jgi:peptidoglycan/LPS O-acetylase OafA/YrhL
MTETDLPKTAIERSLDRMDGVDILRGVSILSVILLHFWLRLHFAHVDLFPTLPVWLFGFLFTNGDNGVTVFFAISGFLITLTSLRRFGSLSAMQPRMFYRIRFARIAPLLLLALAVLSVLHLAKISAFVIPSKVATLPQAVFAALTFHLNYLEGMHGYLAANWDVLWSLSVEEMFYLFFPLICAAILYFKRGHDVFIALLLAFVAMGPFARTIWTAGHPIWREKSYLGGMDAIAMGCLTAPLVDWLCKKQTAWKGRFPVAITLQMVGVALMLMIAIWPPWHIMRLLWRSGLYGTALALGTCLVIVGAVLHGESGSRWTSPVRWFGGHSYEVYMTHEFVVIGVTELYLKLLRGPMLAWLAALLILCALLGWVTARYFSEPMNRKLRGAAPARSI